MADYLGRYSGPAIDSILTNSKENTYRKSDVDRLVAGIGNAVTDLQSSTYTKQEIEDKLQASRIEPCSINDIDSLFEKEDRE